MNVGDYVRTSSGIIAKYLGREGDTYKFDKDIYWVYDYYNDYIYDDDYEEWLKSEDVKVSKELIDLIEVRRLCEWTKNNPNNQRPVYKRPDRFMDRQNNTI